ncbi:uncharacterized protein PODANS_3_7680 [Podospora anserina S mat+]|uniref:Podospora anserina S mat+ genomic DNA chromosome 3, supercontig 2 n=1 Tax=Podospora anserina (strain S / ATCC MYA-4624 / DSM 980 / FGSC 10383) TaxID=515849 RepID=B2B0X9_PODAN|nr:uncharacterized protein PODANS_3_7680 [Podospora anserina S mat+]CAP70704.1 unnamed protein product [Podospora anserina S mat+]CDP27296.1 Putative protein of unknown function [Podospora anserina S mat+]
MSHVTPHWPQPSHPTIQQVIYATDDTSFTTKSLSLITLPPFGLFAKLDFPPCTPAPSPTYATVQCGINSHLNLNSDLLYINHSCDPSLIFDTTNLVVMAGPKGLKVGEELTFFYPSTEYAMAQPFDCFCGSSSCKGRISGARDMKPEQLEGMFLNAHIRELLGMNGTKGGQDDETAKALREVVRAAERALDGYLAAKAGAAGKGEEKKINGVKKVLNGGYANGNGIEIEAEGLRARGTTSRELSGEMGGDTRA